VLDSLDRPDPDIDRLRAVEARDRLAAYRRGELTATDPGDIVAKYRPRRSGFLMSLKSSLTTQSAGMNHRPRGSATLSLSKCCPQIQLGVGMRRWRWWTRNCPIRIARQTKIANHNVSKITREIIIDVFV
jgi:hypothetical protein